MHQCISAKGSSFTNVGHIPMLLVLGVHQCLSPERLHEPKLSISQCYPMAHCLSSERSPQPSVVHALIFKCPQCLSAKRSEYHSVGHEPCCLHPNVRVKK